MAAKADDSRSTMTGKCPSCGHLNRPQATWCESCRKGLNLKGRMAEPWAKTGLGSRVTTTWALFAGGGCLFFFVFPPLGVFLLGIAVVTQLLMKRSIPGICPHCGQATATIRVKGAQPDFPCVHCRQLVHLDTSSGKPVFVKPAGDAGETQGPAAPPGQAGAVEKADWRGVDLSLGHPRVKLETDGGEATYRVRSGSVFGWLWLCFSVAIFTVLFVGLARGQVRVSGRLVTDPGFLDFFQLGAVAALFVFVGLAFSVATYAVTLTHDTATVRWRVLPFLGWTWTLPAGRGTRVFLAHRGAAENRRPVPAVVIASQGGEISFGSFLPLGVKEYLGAAVHDYYNGSGLARISQPIITT